MMTSPSEKKKTPRVPASGVITFDPEACNGCESCELVCSLAHEGSSSQASSRITIHYSLEGEAACDVCQQCRQPSCLYVCPVEAILIHKGSGARYIDERICIGCNQCYDACPFTPKQAMIKAYRGEERITFIKCDLCKDQKEGPMCVKYCPTEALTFLPAESRKRLSKGDESKKTTGG